jgi:TubC N-terminal docking domain
MSALAQLREQGLQLQVLGEQLLVAPRSALTDELRALIRAQKRSILSELAGTLEHRRTARQAKVEAELRACPQLRVAFDVVSVPLDAAPSTPVSIVVAVRHGAHILSGELHVPRERWDTVVFLRTVDAGSARPS